MLINLSKNRLRLILTAAMMMTTSLIIRAQIQEKIKGENGLIRYITPIAPADQFPYTLQALKAHVVTDEHSDLVMISSELDPLGHVNYRLKQTYHGIPIETSMLMVQTNQGLKKN